MFVVDEKYFCFFVFCLFFVLGDVNCEVFIVKYFGFVEGLFNVVLKGL